jgi:hypothetical protein
VSDWKPIETAPQGKEVMTKIHDKLGCRNEQPLVLKKTLWWFPDGSMYVYYAPTHWKEIENANCKV